MDRHTSAECSQPPVGSSGELDHLAPGLGGAGPLGPNLTATAWFRCCPRSSRGCVVLELLWGKCSSDPDRDSSAAQFYNTVLFYLEPNQCEWRESLHRQGNP